jgi:wyosine [tRNA(Phe)-imidazoG37] synthetase (radical SAM superfamily)
MAINKNRLAFGPVPSRRLGRSIGINNIPPKNCTYSCAYCQIGHTTNMQIEQRQFYEPRYIFEATKTKVKKTIERDEKIDFLTFVPDGEPTLDINLGKEIDMLKSLKIKIAVITNGSLVWKKDVQNSLLKADWISIKIDTVSEEVWRKINRPHKKLNFSDLLSGILGFSQIFQGDLNTETMLIKGLNDNILEFEKIADFINKINAKRSYLSIPTRPPSEEWIKPAGESDLNLSYHIFKDRGLNPELLTGYEGNAFIFTGHAEDDLLAITSVHPMREDAVREFLLKANSNWKLIERLIKQGKLVELRFRGNNFYIRKF